MDLQVSPEVIMNREVELECESWTSFASSLFLNSSATGGIRGRAFTLPPPPPPPPTPRPINYLASVDVKQ